MPTLVSPPETLTVTLSTLSVGDWCQVPSFSGICMVLEKRATDTLLVRYSDVPTEFGVALVRANTTLVTPIADPNGMTISWA